MGSTKLSKRGTNPGYLTDKQRVFVAEYLVDFNSARAAKAAGYSNPAQAGSKLLNENLYPLVVKALGHAQQKHLDKCTDEKEWIKKRLKYIIDGDEAKIVGELKKVKNFEDLPEHLSMAIKSIEITYSDEQGEDGEFHTQKHVKLQVWDPTPAAALYMKHLGMLDTKIQIDKREVIDWDSLVDRPTRYADLEAIEAEIGDNVIDVGPTA